MTSFKKLILLAFFALVSTMLQAQADQNTLRKHIIENESLKLQDVIDVSPTYTKCDPIYTFDLKPGTENLKEKKARRIKVNCYDFTELGLKVYHHKKKGIFAIKIHKGSFESLKLAETSLCSLLNSEGINKVNDLDGKSIDFFYGKAKWSNYKPNINLQFSGKTKATFDCDLKLTGVVILKNGRFL